MSDDRFNDDLPDWLRDDDPSDDSTSDEGIDLNWQSGDEQPGQSSDPSRLGVTGELPWMQGVSDPEDPRASGRASSLESVDWESMDDASADSNAADSATFDLPDWLSGGDDDDNEASIAPPTPEPTPDDADMPDWLMGDFDDDGSVEPASIPSPEPASDMSFDDMFGVSDPDSEPVAQSQPDAQALPDWVAGLDDDDDGDAEDDLFASAFSDAIEETGTTPPEATLTDSGLRRIASDNPNIRKLGEAGEKRPEDMTYEEWERFQENQELEKQNAAQREIEEEVPDWFRDNVELGDAERDLDAILMPDLLDDADENSSAEVAEADTDSNYVPEWFLGLDEQNLDDEPEWVKQATSSVDLSDITDTSAFELPVMDDLPAPDDTAEDFAGDDFMAAIGGDEPLAPAGSGIEGLEFEDILTGDVDSAADLDFGMESTASDEPDWMQGISQPSATTTSDDDDFFAGLMDDDSGPDTADDDNWLGELGVDDFTDTSGNIPIGGLEDSADSAPATTAATQEPAPKEKRRGFFSRAKQQEETPDVDEALAGILGDAPDPNRQLVRDDASSRQVLAQESQADINDLFEGVDDEFLEALSSAGPMGEVADSEGRLSGAAMFEGPAWVEGLRPDQNVALSAGGLELEFMQQVLAALPENIQQLREDAVAYLETTSEVETEPITEGTLAGISGGLPPLDVVTRDIELPVGVTVNEQQARRIKLLDNALEVAREEIGVNDAPDDEAEAEQEARPRRRRRRRRVKADRLLITIAMIAAIAAPFISDSFHAANDPELDSIALEQRIVFEAISSLSEGDRVLVAFEYGPTAAGELDPLAEAVLRDVLAQGAVPVSLSTNPLGNLSGRNILNTLAQDRALLNALERDALIAGQDYYTLRYIPGGAVAIRALTRSETTATLIFATDSTGENTNLDIGTIDAADFAMFLVVGETADDVRNWAEQFDVEGMPGFALITSSIEPVANAYVGDFGEMRFQGYLSGYRDTYRYNLLRNGATRDVPADNGDLPNTEVAQWQSIALGAITAAVIILVGTLVNLLRLLRRRRA